MDLQDYRNQEHELARTDDLFRLLPKGLNSVLEIGPRHGIHTRRLTTCFDSVTTLDLVPPSLLIEGVTALRGDVTQLEFPDNSFDCVLCAEVLEHVPAVERAASEIARVTRHEAVIGVPFRQDTRIGRLTCASCGMINPPFGHVNTFDEDRLRALFPRLQPVEFSYVGNGGERTNPLSTWLMVLAGNPWGTYEQVESCIRCGARMPAPDSSSVPARVCAGLASRLTRLQKKLFFRPVPAWMHARFRKSLTAA